MTTPLSPSGKLPRVSIMCPAYNAHNYIEIAMRSVLDQDYEDVELVVSDDCSTDDTAEIARRVAADYPDRNVIVSGNLSNIGITANCNKALGICTGEYICLLAGDDLMYPGKISAQIALFLKNPDASLSYHAVDVIDETGAQIALWEDSTNKYRTHVDIIRNAGIPYTGSMMVKASAIPPWRHDPLLPVVSDWLFLIEVAIRGSIVKLEGVFGAYRRHSAGASRKTFELMEETLSTLDIVQKRYPELKLEDACISARRRYLLGEIARCIITGNEDRLRQVRSRFANGDRVIIVTSSLGIASAHLGLERLRITKWAYKFITRRTKA